jgi:hypothetical protein
MKTPAALYATPASDATSKGPHLARVAELLGLDLFGWLTRRRTEAEHGSSSLRLWSCCARRSVPGLISYASPTGPKH